MKRRYLRGVFHAPSPPAHLSKHRQNLNTVFVLRSHFSTVYRPFWGPFAHRFFTVYFSHLSEEIGSVKFRRLNGVQVLSNST